MTPSEQQAPKSEPPRAPSRVAPLLALLAATAALAFFLVRAPQDRPPAPESEPEDVGDAGAPPRCSAHGASLRIGEGARAAAAEEEDPGEVLEPFAVEIGRASAFDGGFAVGIKRERDGGSFAEIALLGPNGEGGRTLELARARGDVDAPLCVADGREIVAGLLEPNAGGMALRLVRIAGGKLSWGAELEQGRDESLAYDLAVGSQAVVAAWDEADDERSLVRLARLDRALALAEAPAITSGEVDAELPRLASRPGGFWLAYVARARAEEDAGKAPTDAGEDSARYPAERIDPSWVELVPLDESGKPAGVPRAVTDTKGHVLAFDLVPGAGGEALLALRDDDTPSGAGGGKVALLSVGLAGEGTRQPVDEIDIGGGVPMLLAAGSAGWLVLLDGDGRPRLAPFAPTGELTGELRSDPTVGFAQPLALGHGTMLLARPIGKGMELSLVRCAP